LFKRWYQSSLRHQILIWLLVINFLVLLLMAVATLQVARKSVEKNIYEQLEREHVIQSEMIESSLNRMIGEVQSLSSMPTLINALGFPDKAEQILDSVIRRNPLVQDDRNDFYLLDTNLKRIYTAGTNTTWLPESDDLAKKALSQLKTQAAIYKTDKGFTLQLAQPVDARGVLILSQPINQLMGRFFQGRQDLAAWILEDRSGQVLSNLHDSSSTGQTIAKQLYVRADQQVAQEISPKNFDRGEAWRTIKGSLRLIQPLADLHLQLSLNERTNWAKIVALELLMPFLVALIFILIIAIVFITYAGRRLATPLEELASYALSVQGSGFSSALNQEKLAALVSRQDEVGRLSTQFSQMLKRLRQGYLGLEDQVARRNAQLEALFALSPDGFIELDAQGLVGFVNPAFEVLTSLLPAGVIGKPSSELVEKLHSLSRATTLIQIQEMFKASEQFHWLELEIPFKRTLAVLTKANQSDGYIVYLHDITQEAELEEMRSVFMSTAAHELRTPISSILGYSELLMRRLKGTVKPSEDTIQEMAGVIERQSKNMAELVNDLLDLARLENQMAKGLNLHETSLATYLRPVVAQFQMRGDVRDVVTHIDDHLPDVRLHPDSFKRLIVNLLSNAFKYSSSGSPVIVKTFIQKKANQEYVGIAIQDYGDGMSPEDLEHAFERFYRSSAHEAISGTGLGLSIAKEIMVAHAGEIEIQSDLGEGTTVTLLFPAIRKWGNSEKN
jgi:PAS domain S-box-containing protein